MDPIRSTFLALALSATAGAASSADLKVRVEDASSTQGAIMIAVYDAQGFLKRPVKVASALAANPVEVTIKDLPEGEYGIALFHDANGNTRLDRNAMGIPSEDHGFSNNARGHMGPPEFEQVKFAVPASGATTTISLR